LKTAALFALATAISGAASIIAIAQTQWDRDHPRRAEVNGRLENQDARINKEVREGEIAKGRLTNCIARITRTGRRSAEWRSSMAGTSLPPQKTDCSFIVIF
jgi:hypothetical protein